MMRIPGDIIWNNIRARLTQLTKSNAIRIRPLFAGDKNV